MKQYGGYSFKQRKQYLCDENYIIKERFTGKERDYLKKDIIFTLLKLFQCKNQKDIIKIKKYNKQTVFCLLKNLYVDYIKHIDKIILIQKQIINYIKNKNNKLKGPGFIDKSLCKNDEDFLFMTTPKQTKSEYFFSYKDKTNCVWFFDVRSIYELIKTTKLNPYTRDEFPENVIKDVLKIITFLKKQKIDVNIKKYKTEDFKENLKRKTIDLTIDITQCGYTFNSEWLNQLNKIKLIHLYKLLEDMWNYRVEMTIQQKMSIIPPTGIVFNYPIGLLSRKSTDYILDIIINDINKFKNAYDEGNKKLGYIYLIACLSDINIDCLQSNAWVNWL